MKKLIFIALFSIAAMSASQAQFALGAGGGVNFSDARFSGPESIGDAKGITGFHVSVQPRYVFARRWSAITDLQYSRKGAILESANSQFGQRADYFDVLPQVEYRLLERLGVAVGVNVGWSIREEIKYDDGDWEESILSLDLFDDPDFGLLFALRGYYGRFYATMSYCLGLRDVDNGMYTDDTGQIYDAEWYHRNLQIGIGYLLFPGHSADK
jgi:hypothetical protein